MKAILFSLCILAIGAAAEETVTVTVFKMKDGVVHEAIRFSAVGDEGAKTFSLKKTNGERVTVAETDVESRTEKKVLRSELPDSANVPTTPQPAPRVKADSEDDGKQSAKSQAVRRDVEARIGLRKIEDELAQAKARLIPIQQVIADSTAAIAKAQSNSDAAAKELGSIPDAPKAKGPLDPAARDAENRREARRDALRKKIASAEDEKSKQTLRKSDAEKSLAEANEEVKKITALKDAAQKESTTAAAEKSKAIVAANSDSTSEKKGEESPIHTVKLMDGSVIRARSIKKLDDGFLLIVDETGKELRIEKSSVKSMD